MLLRTGHKLASGRLSGFDKPLHTVHSVPRISQAPRAKQLSAQAAANKPAKGRLVQYLYDGNCKVCQTFKSALDAQDGKGNIEFINIAQSSYKPRQHNNVQYDDAMSTIHAITSKGKTVKGPDAVRELFGAAGPVLGWAAQASKLPGAAQAFGLLYDFLAKYRYPISDAVTKTKKAAGR
ncbi:hypothetical protein WJX73_002706 [Symbiochloris irregularis]|uniref:Uncharacterized protein n=1 Tax=Symbiochloris irregularis TaxID=706552 RepID=A0AAW1PFF8_9CHLO